MVIAFIVFDVASRYLVAVFAKNCLSFIGSETRLLMVNIYCYSNCIFFHSDSYSLPLLVLLPLKALVMQLLSLLHLGNSIVVSAASLTYGFRRNHDNRRL